jgi:hypothetical protein
VKHHHRGPADRPRMIPTLREGRSPYTLRIREWPGARHRRKARIIWAWLQHGG